ncbi:MAG: DUF4476 domain-containing protein [Ignavibacteria bacterium]
MKTTKFLLSSAIFTIFLSSKVFFASYLNISLVDNSTFTATINNQNYSQLTDVVEISGIPGGSHYIKIMKQPAPGGTWNTVIFEGYVKIPDNCSVYASVDETGNFMMYKKLYGDKPVIEHHNDQFGIMNSRDFADFKKVINDRAFESTKMDMTKSVIGNNYFNVDQVREILSWFAFESNKLELAKYAFGKTVDNNNYFKLYDIFAFESNVTDLDNYIKNYR